MEPSSDQRCSSLIQPRNQQNIIHDNYALTCSKQIKETKKKKHVYCAPMTLADSSLTLTFYFIYLSHRERTNLFACQYFYKWNRIGSNREQHFVILLIKDRSRTVVCHV